MLLLLLSYSAFIKFLAIKPTKIKEAVNNSFVFRYKFTIGKQEKPFRHKALEGERYKHCVGQDTRNSWQWPWKSKSQNKHLLLINRCRTCSEEDYFEAEVENAQQEKASTFLSCSSTVR